MSISCPTCGSEKFYSGPEGGGAINIMCADCGDTFWYGGLGNGDMKPITRNESIWPPRPEWPKWQPVKGRWFTHDKAVRTWPSGKREEGHITFVLTQPERINGT